ncbi:uncharacterized protein [Dermacentor andersoni]|uniref:uncharacterized protein n=1 Tax=Dermacentor andersoni TaxID=34620 RepID=UPI002416C979|nr:uncharacterized protein LOC126526490 [Dermacentor andersoni]
MDNVGLTPAVRRLLQDLLKEGGNECNGSAASIGVPASGAGQLRKAAARAPGCEWTRGETKLLLDLYSTYFPQVGPLKKFRNKKAMFEKIAVELQRRTGTIKSGEQCCTRYKTVLKRKNVAAVENNTSGNSPADVDYEDELEKIRWLDDSLEPEVVRDASGVVSRKTHPQLPASESVCHGPSSSASSTCSATETAACSLEQEQQPRDDGRKNRPSTARMLQMTAFLEKVEEIEERRAKRKAERDIKKEERRLEKMQRRDQMHAEKMSLLREAFGLDHND